MPTILGSFLQAGPSDVRWATAGASIVLSALWGTLTGVLAAVMVALFLADVGLGVLRAIHVGGLDAFDRDRFGQALIKLGAAMLGILLSVPIDLMLQHVGAVAGTPLTTGTITFMCWGFAWSGIQNLGHFFPGVADRIDSILRRSGATPPAEEEGA